MLSTAPDGMLLVTLKKGAQLVVKKQGESYTSLNMDGIDPDDWNGVVLVADDAIAGIEELSEKRFHWMREMAHRQARINDVTTAMRSVELTEAAKQAGMIQGEGEAAGSAPGTPPAPVHRGPRPSPAPAAPDAAAVAPPSPMPPSVVGAAAQPPENPGAPLSTPENDDGLDGAVVELPPPGQ